MKVFISLGKVFIFICLCLMIIIALFFKKNQFDTSVITNVNDYDFALRNIKRQEKIQHFPKIIPSEAKNIKLYSWSSDVNEELLLLQFKTSKEYISKELKKFAFLNGDSPVGNKQKIYNFPNKPGFISPDKYTFFVLKNDDNEYVFKKYFPYFTGIGVDKKLEHIIYYYIEPAD